MVDHPVALSAQHVLRADNPGVSFLQEGPNLRLFLRQFVNDFAGQIVTCAFRQVRAVQPNPKAQRRPIEDLDET